MDKKIINAKSGIIIKCPQVSTGIVKIILKAAVDLDVYYADKINIDHLKETGNFKDSGVTFNRKGNNIEEFIKTTSGESFFVIVNDSKKDSPLSFEIKSANYAFTGTSGISGTCSGTLATPVMTGYGTSGYKSKF